MKDIFHSLYADHGAGLALMRTASSWALLGNLLTQAWQPLKGLPRTKTRAKLTRISTLYANQTFVFRDPLRPLTGVEVSRVKRHWIKCHLPIDRWSRSRPLVFGTLNNRFYYSKLIILSKRLWPMCHASASADVVVRQALASSKANRGIKPLRWRIDIDRLEILMSSS